MGLASIIPGYSSYLDREKRLDDDSRTRKYLASRLQACKQLLQTHLKSLLQAAKLDEIALGEKLRVELDTIQQKIESVASGNSNWFVPSKITHEVAQTLSQLDSAMVSDLDRVAKALADPNVPSVEPLQVNIEEAIRAASELRLKWERRVKLMRGEA